MKNISIVKVSDIDSTILQFPRYATADNFLGRIVAGYVEKEIYVTIETALAIKAIQAITASWF